MYFLLFILLSKLSASCILLSAICYLLSAHEMKLISELFMIVASFLSWRETIVVSKLSHFHYLLCKNLDYASFKVEIFQYVLQRITHLGTRNNVTCCMFGGSVRDIVRGTVPNDCDILLNYNIENDNSTYIPTSELLRFLNIFSFLEGYFVDYSGKYMGSCFVKYVMKFQIQLGITPLMFDFAVVYNERPQGVFVPDFDVNGLILLAEDSPMKYYTYNICNFSLMKNFFNYAHHIPYLWTADEFTLFQYIKAAHVEGMANVEYVLLEYSTSVSIVHPDAVEQQREIVATMTSISMSECTMTTSDISSSVMKRAFKMASSFKILNLDAKIEGLFEAAIHEHDQFSQKMLYRHSIMLSASNARTLNWLSKSMAISCHSNFSNFRLHRHLERILEVEPTEEILLCIYSGLWEKHCDRIDSFMRLCTAFALN